MYTCTCNSQYTYLYDIWSYIFCLNLISMHHKGIMTGHLNNKGGKRLHRVVLGVFYRIVLLAVAGGGFIS